MKRKNLRKVPASIQYRLKTFADNKVVAACTRQYSMDEVKSGKLGRCGIKADEFVAKVGYGWTFEPQAWAGRYSRRNRRNTILIHKNRPKVQREIETQVTDWHGDKHSITYTRDCYQRTIIPPKHITIDAKIIRVEQDMVAIAFRVNEPLHAGDKDFPDRLLAGLNLLQENVGDCDIELASTEMEKYTHILKVNWTIFPKGSLTLEELARRIHGNAYKGDEKLREDIIDRYEFLMSLNATHIVVGSDTFHGYIGAMLKEDIVVFDSVRFGNAVYILKGNWEELSKKTKHELFGMTEESHRIQHYEGWKNKVNGVLQQLLRNKE